MVDTIDEQLCLHDAASLCSLALLRPAALSAEDLQPILGIDLGREAVLTSLAHALATAWPDRPDEVDDLESFLREASTRIMTRAVTLAGADGFVPAARWTDQTREVLLEHLQLDVTALVGGVRAEGLWFAFAETPDTAPLRELVMAGMLIKLRAVGSFLVDPPSRYKDELTAAAFFTAGTWEEARDTAIAKDVI